MLHFTVSLLHVDAKSFDGLKIFLFLLSFCSDEPVLITIEIFMAEAPSPSRVHLIQNAQGQREI